MIYEDVLARLKEERLAHGLSQAELGCRLRISQGHYSKAEQAVKRLTYYELKCLADTELDLSYIYTGRRCGDKFRELLQDCGSRELFCYLNMVISLACCQYENVPVQESELKKYKSLNRLKYLTGAEERQNLFQLIRRYEKLTQFEMADCLGIDVKKYRGLEKGFRLPDSELIFKLYSLFDITPAYVLRDVNGLSREIEYYLDKLEPKSNKAVYRYFLLLRDSYEAGNDPE